MKYMSIIALVIFKLISISAQQNIKIYINDHYLNQQEFNEVTRIYGVSPKQGLYWYDTRPECMERWVVLYWA